MQTISLRPFFHFFIAFIATSPALLISSSADAGSYFTARTSRSDDLSMFPKWTGMAARYEQKRTSPAAGCETGKKSICATQEWSNMINSVRGKPLRDQLVSINAWANKHPYILDQINWGMEDYWETPYEFIELSGDCEDYAITKYYSLRALGLSNDKLRIIIVQDFNLGGIIHAILGVYDGDELLILDNQIKQVMPAMSIYHYRPIYGINEEEWWAYSP